MNTNLLVRKSTFLIAIKRTYVQLSAVFLFFLLTIGHQAFAADDIVSLVITDPRSVCSPATVDLTLPEVTAGSTPGLIFFYYYDFEMTRPVPDPTKVGTGTYYIVGRRPVPPGSAELPVHVVVDPASAGGAVSGGSSLCMGSSSGLLTLSGNVGTVVKWQSSVSPFSSWTDIADTLTTYTSGVLTQTTQFRAVVQSGSCGQAFSSATTVTISPSTVGGAVSGGSSICTGTTSGLLTLSGHTGSVVKWQSTVSPFNVWTDIAITTTTYISGALTQTTQFRAVVQSGSCAVVNSASTTVIVDPTSVGGIITGGITICSGSLSGVLTLSGHVGTVVKWQSSVSPFSTWTDIANTLTTYNPGILTQTTQFRAVVQSGSCAPANALVTTVTVSPTTVGGTVSGGTTVCIGNTSGVLSLSGHTGTVVKWQSSVFPFSTWTDIVNTETTYISGALVQTTQFRAVVQSGSCATANSFSTTVIVSPTTVGGTVSGSSTICVGGTSGLLTLSGHTGTVVKWQSSVSPFNTWMDIVNTATTYISGALAQTTQFRAVVQSGSCSEVNSATTTVTINPTGAVTGGTSICSGSTSGLLTLSGHVGNVVKWQSSVSPFNTWTDISNTLTTYIAGALTQTTQFRAVVQGGSCPEGYSASTTVTITELSLSFIGTNPKTSGASDGTVDVTITGGTVPYEYSWTGPVPFTETTQNLTGLKYGAYNLIVTDKNGCSKSGSYVLMDPPAAIDDTASTLENNPVTFSVISNDIDADGTIDPSSVDLDPLSAGMQTTYIVDKKGVFSVSITGDVTFRPLPNFYGLVVIQYIVKDNDGLLSNIANITVTVISSNLPPVAVNDTIRVPEHIQAIGNIILNDIDPEGEILVLNSFTIGSTIYNPGSSVPIAGVGNIVVNLNGSFTFTPQGHFYGNVPPIDYTIADVEGFTASATLYIIVTPVNDPPIAINDNFEGKENTILEGNVLIRNPSDPDSDPKNLALTTDTIPVQPPAHGKVVLSPSGDFTYQPLIDFIGTDTFIYRICNNLTPPLCSTATVTIVIAKDDSCKVFVPNVFTPNGDGVHDYFQIRCLYNYDNPEIQIFNRNGNLIFKKDHYGYLDFWGSEELAFWNGRSQHKWNVVNDELPVGTYYYVLKLGDGKVLTGFVFLGK